jgi:hypothetical protein
VLRGRVPAAVFRGKIVVVGATAPSLQDLHATPTSGSDLMPGPEVQANAIWTALHFLAIAPELGHQQTFRPAEALDLDSLPPLLEEP